MNSLNYQWYYQLEIYTLEIHKYWIYYNTNLIRRILDNIYVNKITNMKLRIINKMPILYCNNYKIKLYRIHGGIMLAKRYSHKVESIITLQMWISLHMLIVSCFIISLFTYILSNCIRIKIVLVCMTWWHDKTTWLIDMT